MAAERSQPSIKASSNQPLVGLFVGDDGDAVRYFVDDAQVPSPSPSPGAQEALSVIGAWSDMNWDELAYSLDRIRHDSPPTPPIDLADR